jgi:hypothetical protein
LRRLAAAAVSAAFGSPKVSPEDRTRGLRDADMIRASSWSVSAFTPVRLWTASGEKSLSFPSREDLSSPRREREELLFRRIRRRPEATREIFSGEAAIQWSALAAVIE